MLKLLNIETFKAFAKTVMNGKTMAIDLDNVL